MALSNRDRRNGLILSNSYRSTQQRSYGKFNKRKAKYNLNDIVLDINKDSNTEHDGGIAADFDISNDSFKMTDDEDDEENTPINDEEADFNKKILDFDNDMMNASSDDDFGDEPYGSAQIINIAISDNEDSDIIMESPEKRKPIPQLTTNIAPVSSTPQKNRATSRRESKPLQDLSSSPKINNNINIEAINDKRVPLGPAPSFQRNSSAGLQQFRNRNSLNSNSSKRWSLLSFNNESLEKEVSSNNKSKRFSMASTHSTTSTTKDKSKRFSIASTSSLTELNNPNRNKRFSMASTQSTSSGNSLKNVINKVGNVLSSVSVSSIEDTSESNTPYKSVQPGVVGEQQQQKRFSTSSSILENQSSPLPMRTYSHASTSSTNININTAYHSRDKEYTKHTSQQQQQQPQVLHRKPSLQPPSLLEPHQSSQTLSSLSRRKESDASSMISTSSIRTSKSRFRLSSIFSSKKTELGNNGNGSAIANDNESIRSLRGKSSFSDMRKSVLSMSPSKHNLFRLARKDSLNDLNKKSSLDKTMISLPKPDTNSREKLKTRLRNSSSIISINSVISRQPTNQTMVSSANSNPTTIMTSNEYDSKQLNKLVTLTSYPEVLNFNNYISVSSNANNQVLIKFAEASYSEVYLLKNYQTNEILKIFKIIPFGDGNFEQPSIDNVIQELKITQKLSTIDGFIKLNEASVVKGSYPRLLLKLWDDFNELKESANYRPEYDQDQKYLIMDLEYGGIDLEKFQIKSWEQSSKIFWEIVKTLQNAEEKFQFEHRDLHWGNIVIKEQELNKAPISNEDEDIEDVMRDLSIIEEEHGNEQQSAQGLEVKLIDYTLSRLNGDENDEQDVIFTRLDHQDFFKGCGDYQFDIYRFMRNEIKSIQKSSSSKDEIDWSLSSFKNNLYWLHYLLDKLLFHKKDYITSNHNSKDDQYYKNLQYVYKSLDPRRKKLNNDSIPNFHKSINESSLSNKSNKKRQVVYFQDFQNCSDVLKFGEFYELL
ncbi:Serine/threonine-protein kinase [Wickerhamomyces ciferrii]|uniref:non-specific serine/threonine protein kinase n=1 Tax=Wickerhamomyces ciferrii (strain ATCC 14091 / BCRC 22168 / CBS 111 / JCM 3599 / NBRC 0793 / NRRL Y-1031 F-60-10) TaxID=1206466 RepID=K0KT83_WICCF|nr:Serine/threonine-protein kinase [Wickerhamomyces ciferrii]CCH44513.1 Serine/threonine-protein kinase [Wickerhamomyces ciferrii]